MSSGTRVTTIRLPEELADDVEAVARVYGVTASRVIRDAIATYIEERKATAEFRTRLAASIARDKALLEALS